MVRLAGLRMGEKLYEKHSYCSKCAEWLRNKPNRCPYCKQVTRKRPRYVNHKYSSEGVKRY